MSNCDVCMTADFDGVNEFERITTPKARKQYSCYECRKPILVGEVYESFVAKFDGALTTTRTCLICAEVRNSFYCNGGVIGELWSDMDECGVWERLTLSSACFVKLSAAAKEAVLVRWREWKGLADA